MRLLFVENNDSFTWNVFDSLPFKREQITLAAGCEVARDLSRLEGFDAVLIGPGPTDPLRTGMVAVVQEAARRRLPLLGICLGYQALGLAYGAELVASRPAHGQKSWVNFVTSRNFPHFQGEYLVMRYHSLSLAHIAPPLRLVAATSDGLPMAIEHETLPMAGLQFHPDSFATAQGVDMIADFFRTLP